MTYKSKDYLVLVHIHIVHSWNWLIFDLDVKCIVPRASHAKLNNLYKGTLENWTAGTQEQGWRMAWCGRVPLDHGCQDNNAVITTCTRLMVIRLSREQELGDSRLWEHKQELWITPDTCVWHVWDTCPHLIGMPVGESHWVCENKGRKQTQERQASRTQREPHSTLTFPRLAGAARITPSQLWC